MSKIIQSEGFAIYDIDNPFKMLPKINNKADELSKKLTFSDMIETAIASKTVANALFN